MPDQDGGAALTLLLPFAPLGLTLPTGSKPAPSALSHNPPCHARVCLLQQWR